MINWQAQLQHRIVGKLDSLVGSLFGLCLSQSALDGAIGIEVFFLFSAIISALFVFFFLLYIF